MKTKGIGVMCVSVFVIGFVVGLLLVSVPGVSAEDVDLVMNGDFSDELTGWTFNDDSQSGRWAEAHEVAGRARIHADGPNGIGTLAQILTESAVPTYFSADFELRGYREELLAIRLQDYASICYVVKRTDDSVRQAFSIFDGQVCNYAINDGTTYDKGNIEMKFDYDTGELKIYINGDYKNTFDLPTEDTMPRVGRVVLRIWNQGEIGDGGIWVNAEAFFDNVILEAERECISTVVASDSKGVPKDAFVIGDDMYCFGEGFIPDKYVRMYVVEHQETWAIGDSLVDASGMYVRMHTDERGSFHPDLIWEAVSTEGRYDVVVDVNQNAKWDLCEPMSTVIVKSAEIPEFTSIVVPLVLILAMFLVFLRKRKKE